MELLIRLLEASSHKRRGLNKHSGQLFKLGKQHKIMSFLVFPDLDDCKRKQVLLKVLMNSNTALHSSFWRRDHALWRVSNMCCIQPFACACSSVVFVSVNHFKQEEVAYLHVNVQSMCCTCTGDILHVCVLCCSCTLAKTLSTCSRENHAHVHAYPAALYSYTLATDVSVSPCPLLSYKTHHQHTEGAVTGYMYM